MYDLCFHLDVNVYMHLYIKNICFLCSLRTQFKSHSDNNLQLQCVKLCFTICIQRSNVSIALSSIGIVCQ